MYILFDQSIVPHDKSYVFLSSDHNRMQASGEVMALIGKHWQCHTPHILWGKDDSHF